MPFSTWLTPLTSTAAIRRKTDRTKLASSVNWPRGWVTADRRFADDEAGLPRKLQSDGRMELLVKIEAFDPNQRVSAAARQKLPMFTCGF